MLENALINKATSININLALLNNVYKTRWLLLQENQYILLALVSYIYCCVDIVITKTRLFKYIENFAIKNWKFSDKNSDIFHVSAQNIDCGYS